MGIYGEQVVPRLTDLCCGLKANDELRRRVCAGLAGEVLEIGFGSGHNVRFYPPEVRVVRAVEPSDVGWRMARERVTGSPVPVQRVGLDGASLPVADHSQDAALSTWTLCTIPGVDQALRELRRVLRPGASFHFVEHGLAPDRKVQRWHHRLEPVQKAVVGGCHLTRPVLGLLEDAGFVVVESEAFYEKGAPKSLGAMTLGRAVSP